MNKAVAFAPSLDPLLQSFLPQVATLEGQWQPVALYHLSRGLRWPVREVLGGWTHPGWPG